LRRGVLPVVFRCRFGSVDPVSHRRQAPQVPERPS
jgi:hypothetical protein